MRPHLRIASLLVVLSGLTLSASEDADSTLRDRIKNTYDFKPSSLSTEQSAQKSKAMDAIWDAVKADPKGTLPILRAALADPAADPFFCFDGSNLLLEHDASSAAKMLQIASYARSDLHEIALREWVMTMAKRGTEGFDTTAAACRWLEDPKFSYTVPEHAFTVTANEGALFLYGSMDETFATPALAKIAADVHHPGRESAFWVLMNQATPEAVLAVKHISPDGLSDPAKTALSSLFASFPVLTPRSEPQMSRQQFLDAFHAIVDKDAWELFDKIKEEDEDGEVDAVAVLKNEDIPLVRMVRRLRISRGHQHAIEDYDSFTSILMTMIWKPEWPKPSPRTEPVSPPGGEPVEAKAVAPAPPDANEMVYTLGKNESLSAAARKFNVDLTWIIMRNDIQDEATVKEGLRLIVPRPAGGNAPKP